MDDHHLEQLHLKIEIKKNKKRKEKKVIPIAIQVPTSLLRSLVGRYLGHQNGTYQEGLGDLNLQRIRVRVTGSAKTKR